MTGPPDFLIVPPEQQLPSIRMTEEATEPSAQASAFARDDPLSDVLASVRLTGALFFVVDASSPWCIDVPHARHYAPIVMPRSQHLFSYHIAVRGCGFASIPGAGPIPYEAGDILVFAHGDGYKMQDTLASAPEFDFDQTITFMRALAEGALPFVVLEGGGGAPAATTICGFLGCDARPFNPILASLPRMLRLRRPPSDGHDLLDRLIDLTVEEAQAARPGGRGISLRLAELMFLELLRRYIAAEGPKPPGWLAGFRDVAIARVLAAIHARPGDDWSVDLLARHAGVSRSSLAERFSELVGQSPIQYLTRWRMQLASRLLTESTLSVAEVGRQIGYEAEPAFSRRFKAVVGVSPSEWRDIAET